MCEQLTEAAKPGQTGDPLIDEDEIIRVGTTPQSNYDVISAQQFEMSTAEREEDWKRISVFERSLTSRDQALSMVPTKDKRIVAYLVVGEVRGIAVQERSPLDVVWDRWEECIDEDGNSQPRHQPGCEGHCGIKGVDVGNKPFRKEIRRQLAKLAMEGEWVVVESN